MESWHSNGMGIMMTDAKEYPVITAGFVCENWKMQSGTLLCRRECRYCFWANFRNRMAGGSSTGICRCPQNQTALMEEISDCTAMLPDSLIRRAMDAETLSEWMEWVEEEDINITQELAESFFVWLHPVAHQPHEC